MNSSNTKNKIKAFQFIAGAPGPQYAESKENQPPQMMNNNTSKSPLPKAILHAKATPTTPLNTTTRLPLTHLIGQQASKPCEDAIIPEELQWKGSTLEHHKKHLVA